MTDSEAEASDVRAHPTVFFAGLLLAGASASVIADEKAPAPRVEVVPTPGGGVQPQAVVDPSGVIHLAYLAGEPGASDVFYTTRKPGESEFGLPIRVNSEAGSAIAVGTVRGARIAIGRAGRVHVLWNGSQRAMPPNPIGGTPLLYARSEESRARFEPQRNLMTKTHQLDGGGAIAADGSGNVFAIWHGQARHAVGEGNRRVWIALSSDEGATFSAEEPASLRPSGTCGCCGLAAMADREGRVAVLYRAATDGLERDMIVLNSRDHGRHFDEARLDPWRINACPMSTCSLVGSGSAIFAAWETRGQVAFTRIGRDQGDRSPPASPTGGDGTRKHPSLATNDRGETLLTWAEGTGWQKGGSLCWQAFDRSGRPLGPGGKSAGAVPVWGASSVVALPDGGFLIIR